MVQGMVGYGIPQEDICKLIINPKTGEPISVNTLRAYFRTECDRGKVLANGRVAGALFKNATDEMNVTAQIFWLKTRAQWKDRDEDQTPVTVNVNNNLDIARRIAYALRKGMVKPST